MKKGLSLCALVLILILAVVFRDEKKSPDLTVVGYINYADGLGRQPVDLINLLKNDLDINFISSVSDMDLNDIPEDVISVLKKPFVRPGKMSILENILWVNSPHFINREPYKQVPDSHVKVAYSMLESSKIPNQWVAILNKNFDAVVVPDNFLVSAYKSSGVQIPIFELPLGVDLDKFLEVKNTSRPRKPFAFGTTASMDPRKNLPAMLIAFAEEFGNNDSVVFKLHSRSNYDSDRILALLNHLNLSNLEFYNQVLDKESYVQFMDSLDCYINTSKGEGFSVCPREALALGLPCILSNNSAQCTLCKTNLVKSLPSLIEEPAYYGGLFGSEAIGVWWNFNKEDLKAAMRDVYENYEDFLAKAHLGREWVKRYQWKNFKSRYLNLVKPKKVILGDKNEITDDYLMTDSLKFYKKMLLLKK